MSFLICVEIYILKFLEITQKSLTLNTKTLYINSIARQVIVRLRTYGHGKHPSPYHFISDFIR